MAADGAEGAWSAWEIFVTLVSGGALTASISGIFWFGHKAGKNDADLATLRTDLDGYRDAAEREVARVDERMNKMRDKIDGLATREDLHQMGASFQAAIAQMGQGMQQSFTALTARIDSALFRRGD